MSIYDEYDFPVIAVHPSGLLNYQSGHATSSRRFLVGCEFAEEFALRQLGKYYYFDAPAVPFLPAPFPFGSSTLGYGQLNMVAKWFSIEPVCAECFNVSYQREESDETDDPQTITDPTSIEQMEKYWHQYPDGQDNSSCMCYVTISYEENPCDCLTYDNETDEWVAHDFILPNTCISVERNPSYEMFTLPNGNLVWSDIPEGPDRRLKADSYAYKIIPKADIIVSWHNLPVNKLCQIEGHLTQFRGHVNHEAWGDQLSCDYVGEESDVEGCQEYEAETILFIDWQEDRSMRTDAFGGMRINGEFNNRNTTTLKLMFKQKRIVVPANLSNSVSDDDIEQIVGWNHLFMDREHGVDSWMRVEVESTGEDLFPLASFNTIMYPLI